MGPCGLGRGFYFFQFCSIQFASHGVLCVTALLSKQHSDDMKAVTHEVRDCKVKLDAHREYVTAFFNVFTLASAGEAARCTCPADHL